MSDGALRLRGSASTRYTVLRRLGKGGMAEVFLARQEGLAGFRRLAVVKRILPQLAQMREVAEMLLDEARIAAQLTHPNIVQIYDLGEEGGQYFIAMEFVDGCDLATLARIERHRQSRIPLRLSLRAVSEAAMGLDYAHRQPGLDGRPLNIVHRDVSPHNILCSREGAVKVTDFGIAKAVGKSLVTQVGVVKGKVQYMAPEQYTGGQIDHRSDIFSLGVVLYQLSTGRLPRAGEGGNVPMRRLIEGRIPRPSEILPDYPEALEAIVMRALARSPADRYPDAATLRDDLLAFSRENDLLAFPKDLGSYVNTLLPPSPLVSREQSFASAGAGPGQELAARLARGRAGSADSGLEQPPNGDAAQGADRWFRGSQRRSGGALRRGGGRDADAELRLPSVMVEGEDEATAPPQGTEVASPGARSIVSRLGAGAFGRRASAPRGGGPGQAGGAALTGRMKRDSGATGHRRSDPPMLSAGQSSDAQTLDPPLALGGGPAPGDELDYGTEIPIDTTSPRTPAMLARVERPARAAGPAKGEEAGPCEGVSRQTTGEWGADRAQGLRRDRTAEENGGASHALAERGYLVDADPGDAQPPQQSGAAGELYDTEREKTVRGKRRAGRRAARGGAELGEGATRGDDGAARGRERPWPDEEEPRAPRRPDIADGAGAAAARDISDISAGEAQRAAEPSRLQQALRRQRQREQLEQLEPAGGGGLAGEAGASLTTGLDGAPEPEGGTTGSSSTPALSGLTQYVRRRRSRAVIVAVVVPTLLAIFVLGFWLSRRPEQPLPPRPQPAAGLRDQVAAIPSSGAGVISVIANPPEATVSVDGARRCPSTPCQIAGLPLNRELLLVLRREGYSLWMQRVVLTSSEPRLMLRADLLPLEEVRPAEAGGPVGTTDASVPDATAATAAADGAPPGKGTAGSGVRPGGRAPGGRTVSGQSKGQMVTIPSDSPTPVLAVDVSPWAEVWIDGKKVGHTPRQVELTPGWHTVELRNPERNFRKVQRVLARKHKKVKMTELIAEPPAGGAAAGQGPPGAR